MAKWRSSYYVRLVLSYTALALVLIGFTGGYLLSNADRMVTSELSKDASYNLQNITNSIESNFLKNYEDAFINDVLRTVNPNSSDRLNYLLDQPAHRNMFQIVSFINDLGLITDMTEGLSGITVYFRKGEYVMDERRYYEVPENSPDVEFIRSLGTAPIGQWFVREKPNQPNDRVMTYVYALPYFADATSASGFLYLDISMKHLNSMVRNVIQTPNSKLYVLDPSGSLLMGEQYADVGERNAVHDIYRSVNRGDTETSFIRLGGNVISVLPSAESSYGWTYVLVRPMDSFLLSAEKLKRQVWTASFLALLLGIVVSLMMSRHFYTPLKRLLYSIRNLHPGPPPSVSGHEYAVIDQMLMFIDRRMLQMKDQVRAGQIAALVTGQRSAAGFGALPAIPLECRYAVGYLVTEPEHAEELKRLAGSSNGISAELVSLSATELALLIFIFKEGLQAKEAVEAAVAMIRASSEDRPFGAGIGSVVDSIEGIHRSYLEGRQAYKYTFVYGREEVILHDDIFARREVMLSPEIAYDQFQHRVQAGGALEAEQWLDALADRLRTEPISVETIELVCLRLSTLLTQIVVEQKLQDIFPVLGFQEPFASRTLEETFGLLKELSRTIAKHIHETRNNAHQDKMYRLKAYIDEHMADDLSLEELAGKAGLSPNYVSTLFGTITGESFTEYLNRIRLERAAKLLVEDITLSVAAIARMTGYRNSQYFCTKFKSKYGITPLQYRSSQTSRARLAE